MNARASTGVGAWLSAPRDPGPLPRYKFPRATDDQMSSDDPRMSSNTRLNELGELVRGHFARGTCPHDGAPDGDAEKRRVTGVVETKRHEGRDLQKMHPGLTDPLVAITSSLASSRRKNSREWPVALHEDTEKPREDPDDHLYPQSGMFLKRGCAAVGRNRTMKSPMNGRAAPIGSPTRLPQRRGTRRQKA